MHIRGRSYIEGEAIVTVAFRCVPTPRVVHLHSPSADDSEPYAVFTVCNDGVAGLLPFLKTLGAIGFAFIVVRDEEVSRPSDVSKWPPVHGAAHTVDVFAISRGLRDSGR